LFGFGFGFFGFGFRVSGFLPSPRRDCVGRRRTQRTPRGGSGRSSTPSGPPRRWQPDPAIEPPNRADPRYYTVLPSSFCLLCRPLLTAEGTPRTSRRCSSPRGAVGACSTCPGSATATATARGAATGRARSCTPTPRTSTTGSSTGCRPAEQAGPARANGTSTATLTGWRARWPRPRSSCRGEGRRRRRR
jgi:hypothetical protein